MQFDELSLIKPILKAVGEAGYTQPSPIQKKAIPPVLDGRDLLGCAQTGTGKTAAFALPILQRLAKAPTPPKDKKEARPIRALILTPTRELALQIEENFEMYAKYLPLRSTVIFGGVGQKPQVQQLKKGVDILVATPGRLIDLINQGYIKLASVEVFVLDEADRMLDMGFVHDVKKIVAKLPQKRQTLLFSATMPGEITKLADSLLNNPAKVFVAPAGTAVKTVKQSLYKLDKANKKRLLAHLLKTEKAASALVFTRTKHGADRVVKELKRAGITAMAIHGSKSQTSRQLALAQFKKGQINVLVATDIAARGIDINELSHVFNYDLPNIPETYVHRIGRTGRAGRGGVAISFCSLDEDEYLKDIEKLIGFKVDEVKAHPWPRTAGEETEQTTEKEIKIKNSNKQAEKTNNIQNNNKNRVNDMNNKQDKKTKGNQPQKNQGRENAPKNTKTEGGAQAATKNRGGKKNRQPYPPRQQNNPYENRKGGGAIITKTPVWGSGTEESKPQPKVENRSQNDGRKPAHEAEAQKTNRANNNSGSNNNRRRKKSRGGQGSQGAQGGQNGQSHGGAQRQDGRKAKNKQDLPEIPKDDRGLFDFSEAELAADNSMRLISDNNGDNKYASFEDFLKDH